MLHRHPLDSTVSEAAGRGGQNEDFRPLTYTLGGGGDGVQGKICDILTPASYESLTALSGHTYPHTLDTYIRGGGRGGRALILDRCRAFDVFASVDAHLCLLGINQDFGIGSRTL